MFFFFFLYMSIARSVMYVEFSRACALARLIDKRVQNFFQGSGKGYFYEAPTWKRRRFSCQWHQYCYSLVEVTECCCLKHREVGISYDRWRLGDIYAYICGGIAYMVWNYNRYNNEHLLIRVHQEARQPRAGIIMNIPLWR